MIEMTLKHKLDQNSMNSLNLENLFVVVFIYGDIFTTLVVVAFLWIISWEISCHLLETSQMVMFFWGRKIGFSKCCWNVISSGLHVSSNLQRQWSISQGHLEFSEHIHYNPNSPRKTHNYYKGCLNKLCLNPLTVPYINIESPKHTSTFKGVPNGSVSGFQFTICLGFKDGTPLRNPR